MQAPRRRRIRPPQQLGDLLAGEQLLTKVLVIGTVRHRRSIAQAHLAIGER